MVKLLIVRHGFSTSNKDGTFTGQLDVPLSREGIIQAELVSDYILNNYDVGAVYSSDLIRAVDTVKKVADTKNLPIVTDKRLREVFCGKWEGLLVEKVKEIYKEDYLAWKRGSETAYMTGGENMLEVKLRAVEAVKEITKKCEGKTVVIATHGGLIKPLLSGVLGVDYQTLIDMPWATNASITELDYEDEKFSLVKFSFDDYLGELKTGMPKGI